MTSASVAYSPLVAGMFLLCCHTLAYLCMYCNVPPLAVVYNLNIWLYFKLLSPMLMRAVVTELSEIVAVSVENQTVSPGGVGYQVNTWTLFGYSLQLTCTWSVDCVLCLHWRADCVAFYTQPTSMLLMEIQEKRSYHQRKKFKEVSLL